MACRQLRVTLFVTTRNSPLNSSLSFILQEPKSKETSDVHAERKTEINSSDVQQMKDGTLKRQEAETGREQVSDHQSADRKKAELDEPEKFTHVDARGEASPQKHTVVDHLKKMFIVLTLDCFLS